MEQGNSRRLDFNAIFVDEFSIVPKSKIAFQSLGYPSISLAMWISSNAIEEDRLWCDYCNLNMIGHLTGIRVITMEYNLETGRYDANIYNTLWLSKKKRGTLGMSQSRQPS